MDGAFLFNSHVAAAYSTITMPHRQHIQLFSHPFLDPDTTSLRLLEILDESSGSRREGHNRTVISRLRTFSSPSSSQTPKYAAISYTWGNPFPKDDDLSGVKDWESPTKYILCNDERFHTGQNLYDALQELVRRGRFGFYWIDSVCIDQQNLLERNAQVAIMGEIFRNATEVICWLGRTDRHLEDAVELHLRMALVNETFGDIEEATSGPEQIDRACRDLGIKTDGHHATASLYKSCLVFWRRRWFQRLWVAQEVALARQLTVLCGDENLSWQHMVLVALHARKASTNFEWTIFFNLPNDHGRSVRRFERIRQHQEHDMGTPDLLHNPNLKRAQVRNAFLLDVLKETAPLKATDPRDKIYGVLGLVLRALSDKQRPIKHIHVDYSLSLCELYTRFATALIIDLPYLSLMGCDTRDADLRDTSLPSWVPDFSQRTFGYSKIVGESYKAGVLIGQRSLREVKNGTLRVSGHRLDSISLLCPVKSRIEQLRFTLGTRKRSRWQPNLIESFCRTLLYQYKHLRGRDRNRFQAFLLVELSTLAARAEHTLLQSLKTDLEAARHESNAMIPARKTIETWTMPDLRTYADKVEMLRAEKLAGKFKATALYMKFGITKSGLLTGTRFHACIGDQVWIVRDAQVPIILRPIPDSTQFTLVGDAYVDGVMYGEALKDRHCPRPVTVEIV